MLVRAAQAGDAEAFRALYERHVAGVHALARSIVGETEGAEDVTQTTFLRAWKELPRLRDRAAFRVWIRQTARRASVDELRRRGSHRAASLDQVEEEGEAVASDDAAPEDLVLSTERTERIRRAVDTLPEHQRSVVVLHHLDGLEVREVAEVLGVPFGTVLSRLARAREALHRKLAGVVDDEA